MSFDPIGAALGLGPFAAQQVKAFRDRNEIRNLFRLVRAELEQRPEIPHAKRETVLERVDGLKVDPWIGALLTAHLDDGRTDVFHALEQRLSELLVFEDEGVPAGLVVSIVREAVEKRGWEAKKGDRAAGHYEAQLTRETVTHSTDEIKHHIDDALESQDKRLTPAAYPTASVESSTASSPLSGDLARVLDRVERTDEAGARALEAALRAGGAERIAELVRAPQDWLQGGSPELWEAVGEAAQLKGFFDEAVQAFEAASQHPGVADRPRQLVRAALAAEMGGDDARFGELLEQARTLAVDNPAVVIAEARMVDDPAVRVERLSDVEPVDARQRVFLEASRAEAALALQDFDRAMASLEAAREAEPENPMVEELTAVLKLLRAQGGDRSVGRDELVEAGELFARYADEKPSGRPEVYGVQLGRAAQAFALANEEDRANMVLRRAETDEALVRLSATGPTLGEAALLLRRFDLVERFVPDDAVERHELLRASALVLEGSRRVEEGARNLDALLDSSDERIQTQAAFGRLSAATVDENIEWSVEAEEILEREQPSAVAMLKAERLADAGDIEGAEDLLRPYAARTSALRYLVQLATRREDWATAIRLSDQLLRLEADDADRIQHGKLLVRGGESRAAHDHFLSIARDGSLAKQTRVAAFAEAADISNRAGDYVELERIAEEWFDYDRVSDEAYWLRLFALARQTRYHEALHLYKADPFDARTEQQALLIAELYSVAGERREALERVGSLSDAFGRPEHLEFAFLTTVLRSDQKSSEALPPELERRIKEGFETFPERFPDSRLLQAHSIDPHAPAPAIAELVRASASRSEPIRDAQRGVDEGTSPVSAIASAAAKSVGHVWLRLPRKPLGYSDPTLSEIERADATGALEKGGAVWDPASIFIVGELDGELLDLVQNALPVSSIAQATLDEASNVLREVGADERGELALDPATGELILIEFSDEDLQREQARAEGSLRLARSFVARPNRLPEEDDELARVLDEEMPLPLLTWGATLAVARRLALPIFSDDRYIRLSARQMGLPAFGTVALLDVLANRKILDPSVRETARQRLLASGAVGLELTSEEFIARARADAWVLSRPMISALTDKSAWRSSPGGLSERLFAFLNVALVEAGEKFTLWVWRVFDALVQSLPDVPRDQLARDLLTMAINPFTESPRLTDEALQAFIEAMRDFPDFRYSKPPQDLVVSALNHMLQALGPGEEKRKALLLRRSLARLSQADQALVYAAFVR